MPVQNTQSTDTKQAPETGMKYAQERAGNRHKTGAEYRGNAVNQCSLDMTTPGASTGAVA